MKQGVILKVFLWHSQQLQKLFSKDIEMKTHMSHINVITVADRKNAKLHIQSRLLLGCQPDIRFILL